MMNPGDDGFVEPPEIALMQDEAHRAASHACERLREMGFDYALVSVACRVDFGGHSAAPGASALLLDRRIRAGLANEAASLRMIADQLERLAGGGETIAGYVQDVTPERVR